MARRNAGRADSRGQIQELVNLRGVAGTDCDISKRRGEADDEFSIDRLEEVVRSKETEPAASLVTQISKAVSTFAGQNPQVDDLTVVVVKVL